MKKNKKLLIVGLVAALVLVVFVLVYFEPQSALMNTKSDQSQKGDVLIRNSSTSSTGLSSPSDSSTTTSTTQPSRSTWNSREHETTGSVLLTRDSDGNTYVRFENLDTTNGPDLRVIIAKSLESGGAPVDYVDLGGLTANQGNANYLVPNDVDINEYSYVVIWCRRFSASFADAQI